MNNVAAVEKNLGNIPPIIADSGVINQVIVSILLNAAFAMKERLRGSIGLLLVTTFADEDFVCCVIGDNGTGILAENNKDIFTPFFTTKVHGTGLGLAIANRIVSNHFGTIKADNTELGAAFSVVLPLAAQHE